MRVAKIRNRSRLKRLNLLVSIPQILGWMLILVVPVPFIIGCMVETIIAENEVSHNGFLFAFWYFIYPVALAFFYIWAATQLLGAT